MYIRSTYFSVKLFLLLFTIINTLYFGSLYVGGDQIYYSTWYREIGKREFLDAYNYFAVQINAFEIFYFFVTWLGASHLDKIVFDCLVNVILVYLFVSALQKYSMSPFVILVVIITSFYLPILLLAAERLKFGFIAGFLFILASTNLKRNFWGVISLVGHLQMSIPLGALLLGKIFDSSITKYIKELFTTTKFFGFSFFIILIFSVFFVLPGFLDYIEYKLFSYLKLNPFDFFKQFIFFLLSLYCATRKWRFVLGVYIFIGVASIILGGERITIISYFAFLFFSALKNRGVNFANYIVCCYMIYKSIFFYINIYFYGNGFVTGSSNIF